MIKRIIIKTLIIILALVLAFIGIGFFIGALYLYLKNLLDNPAMAALLCGVAFLLIAVLFLVFVSLYKGREKGIINLDEMVTNKLPSVDDALDLVKQHPLQTSAVALAVGFVFGFSPKVRDKVIETVGSYLKCQPSEKDSD